MTSWKKMLKLLWEDIGLHSDCIVDFGVIIHEDKRGGLFAGSQRSWKSILLVQREATLAPISILSLLTPMNAHFSSVFDACWNAACCLLLDVWRSCLSRLLLAEARTTGANGSVFEGRAFWQNNAFSQQMKVIEILENWTYRLSDGQTQNARRLRRCFFSESDKDFQHELESQIQPVRRSQSQIGREFTIGGQWSEKLFVQSQLRWYGNVQSREDFKTQWNSRTGLWKSNQVSYIRSKISSSNSNIVTQQIMT